MHMPAFPVWLGGLIWLIFNRKHRDFRVFAWAFLITLVLIILLRGKFYYTIAAYTMLVVFGAVAWEHWAKRPRRIIALMVPIFFGSYPTKKLDEDWEESWQESKGRFSRKTSEIPPRNTDP